MATHYHNIDEGISALSFFFPNIPVPTNISRDAARGEVDKIFRQLIKERREAIVKGEHNDDASHHDLLRELLGAKYRSGVQMPDEHIVGILIAALFGGQHTSSIASTWTLINILLHKDVFVKVMKEQEEVLGALNAKITFENIKQMEYLEKCIRESLRMNPPIIMVMRECKKDKMFNDFVIPKGHTVVVSPAITGRTANMYIQSFISQYKLCMCPVTIEKLLTDASFAWGCVEVLPH